VINSRMRNLSLEPSTEIVASETPLGETPASKVAPSFGTRIANAALAAALLGSVLVWLVPIRSALWFDETISYWQISAGFRPIWSRQGLSFPAYNYILWIWTKIFGTSEVALRSLSVLAMLAAVYVLYRIAREFFETSVAVAACVVFCLHPIVVYAAIDARPYAFAVLVVNGATLCFLRWMRVRGSKHVILAGVTSGLIFYFHYLFAVMLLAFFLLLIHAKAWQWKGFWRQATQGLVAFAVVMLPIVSHLVWLVQTRQEHVIDVAPLFKDLAQTFAPGYIALLFVFAMLLAIALHKLGGWSDEGKSGAFACLTVAWVPLLVLYGTSTVTPIHVFALRYRMVAIPGIALCWALLLARIDSRLIRAGFCLVLLAAVAQKQFDFPIHGSDASGMRVNSWKAAIAAVNANTVTDHAPVLMCSDLVESNVLPIPADAKTSSLFAPLSYYKIQSPVVPLPMTMNSLAKNQLQKFLSTAVTTRERFLAMAYQTSAANLRAIGDAAGSSYESKALGTYDGVMVVEYDPR